MTAGVGAWNAPFDGAGVLVVDDTGEEAEAVVVGEVVPGAAAGAFTLNWVPVTTVTWAPSVGGPSAVITAPDIDRATAWAAAMSTGVFWAK